MSALHDLRPLLDQVRAACDGADPSIAAGLDRLAARLDEPLIVAIAGKVKAGKSTLLNSLVGEQLAPTDAGECTQIVTWYRNGPRATITVTAKWGWSTIPDQIVEACKLLTKNWLDHRHTNLGVVGVGEDGFALGEREQMALRKAVASITGHGSVPAA